MMQTTVLVSILMICVGAAVFLRHRPRWTRVTTGAPDDLGGIPVTASAPVPGPPPAAAPPTTARTEPAPAPAARHAEIVETPAKRPAPAIPATPAARRARANSGFDRFASPAARARAGRV
ncbi:hypothetical protein [Actinoplanes sp. NPDC049118]|uniref:hypothetical protein n=1 Tax=Actinoplanes sp. NPDC049118 TaxID=3155769 RepID=UPI003401E22F